MEPLEDNQEKVEALIKNIIGQFQGMYPQDSIIEYVRLVDLYAQGNFIDFFIEYRTVSKNDFRYSIVDNVLEKDTEVLKYKLKNYFKDCNIRSDLVDVRENSDNIFPHSIFTFSVTIEAI